MPGALTPCYHRATERAGSSACRGPKGTEPVMQHTQQILAGVNWTGGLTSMWTTFTNWVPKFIGFLIVLAIGWFVAKLIGRAVEALERSKYDAPKLVGLLAKYIVVLIVLQLALGVLGSNPISNALQSVIAWLPRGIVALAIIVIVAMIARVVRDLVTNMLSSLSYGRTLGNLAAICIMALGAFAALGQAGIATSVTGPLLIAILATVAGVVIVGVGGGLVRPMQQRWERVLGAAEREAGNVVGAAQSSGAMAGSRMGGAGMGESGMGSASGRMASGGEAYAAGHSDATQAAEEEARRARERMTGEGGMTGSES
jgi:Conserved TM helix